MKAKKLKQINGTQLAPEGIWKGNFSDPLAISLFQGKRRTENGELISIETESDDKNEEEIPEELAGVVFLN